MNGLEIGKNIYNFRKNKGITQEELSKVMDVSIAAVSKWENGTSYPDITLLPTIATFFDITIDELIGYKKNITEEEMEKIAVEAMEVFNENYENGLNFSEKYMKKFKKSYDLKSFFAATISLKASMAKNEEKKRIGLKKALAIHEEIIFNSNKEELVETSTIAIGNIYGYLKEYDKAIEFYNKIKKNLFSVEIMIGNIYLKKNETEKAREIYKKSLRKNIDDIEILIGTLGSSYKNENIELYKKYFKLREKILKALEKNKDLVQYNYELDLAMENDNEEEIIKTFKSIVEEIEKIENLDVFNNLPWYYPEIKLEENNFQAMKLFKFNTKNRFIENIKVDNKYKKILEIEEIKELIK